MKDGTLLCGWFGLVTIYSMGSSFWRLLFCFVCIRVFSCHYSLGWVATGDHFHQFYSMQFGLNPKVICQHFFVTFWQNFSTDFLFFESIVVLFQSQGLQQCQHLLCVCGRGGGEDHKSFIIYSGRPVLCKWLSRKFCAHAQTLVKLGSAILLALIIRQYVTSFRGYHRWLACEVLLMKSCSVACFEHITKFDEL